MSSLLQQLANNESVLLMYLADELPEEDRAEVEQMLQTDAGFRAELERLTEAHRVVTDAIAQDDRSLRIPPADVSLRRLSRRLRQWQVEQEVPHEEDLESVAHRRWPIWGYPVSAAALLAIGLLIWWWALPDEPFATPNTPWGHRQWVFEQPTPEAQELVNTFESSSLTDELYDLYASEQELQILQELSFHDL